MAVLPAFEWAAQGKAVSPAEVARQRKVAEALASAQPAAQGPWGAFGQVASALSGAGLNSRAAELEEAGRTEAGNLFAGIDSGASADAIIAALNNPAAEWATPGQSSVASALLGNQLQQADPAYQLDLAYKQAQIDNMGNSAASTMPSNIQEWMYYSGLSPEEQSQYLTMKRSNSPLNIGTGFVTQDPANPGQVLGEAITIDNQTPAYDKGVGGATGTAAGENQVLAESVQRKMPGLRATIDTLTQLADTATYTQGGQVMDSVKRELGLPVGQGAIDRASYIAIVDNQVLPLLRDTFGAAFTVQEGESLRATLGNPNASPAEKKAILDAFISQKERDIAAMTGQAAAPAAAPVVRVFNPETGRLE